LPWCVRKCPYCDFNSYEARGVVPEPAYVAALLRDLEADLPLAQGRELASVFIGGGTPSLFFGKAIADLMTGIRARLPVARDAEITLEANPGAAEVSRFAQYRDAGVNRLSIGIQSWRDAQLRKLGRVHDGAEALRAVAGARAAGFDNLNLDLMYGLPDDDVDGALADVRAALELAPEHLSWYQLTLEPSTAFHRRPPRLPPETAVIETEQAGRALLAERGYARYEISAYARTGRRCRHNLNYWYFGDYLGVGAGAHGKVTRLAAQDVLRRAKQRNPRTYVEHAGEPSTWSDQRIADGIALEFMMNALRLVDGVEVSLFEARTGTARRDIDGAVRSAVARGWLADRPDRLQPTTQGLDLLNRLLELF
jgi:oxygen-independent coproporphyrinogen-3 oxidase